MPDKDVSQNDEPDIVITEADLQAADQISRFFQNPTPVPMAPMAIVEAICAKIERKYYLQFEQSGQKTWILRNALDDHTPAISGSNPAGAAVRTDLVSGKIYWAALKSGQASCPYCSAQSVVKCGKCSRLSCWVGGSKPFKCGWCGNAGKVSGTIKSISGSEGKKKR